MRISHKLEKYNLHLSQSTQVNNEDNLVMITTTTAIITAMLIYYYLMSARSPCAFIIVVLSIIAFTISSFVEWQFFQSIALGLFIASMVFAIPIGLLILYCGVMRKYCQ